MRYGLLLSVVVTISISVAAQVASLSATSRASGSYFDADPVELSVGYYSRSYTDIFVEDSIPIEFSRTQRNMDKRQRTFGMGGTSSFDMFIYGDSAKFSWVALFMPNGGDERFERISSGTGYTDGVFENRTSPTIYGGARIRWQSGRFGLGGHWLVERRDGTQISINACSPSSKPGQCAVTEIKNRHGEKLTIDRDRDGNLLKITSPNNHSVRFLHDSSGRIIHAADDSGHWVLYSYDKSGCLIKAMTSHGDVQRFKYDVDYNMTEVRESGPAGDDYPPYELRIENEFDKLGRTTKQRISNGDFYNFSYVPGENGLNREVEVEENSGTTRYVFTDGYITHEEYTSKLNPNWKLDFIRDPQVNADLGVRLTCSNNPAVELPSQLAQRIEDMGEKHKQFVSSLCQNHLRVPAPQIRRYEGRPVQARIAIGGETVGIN